MAAREIREKVLHVARSNMYGEQGANNDGAFIRAMGGRPGEEWCALYAGYCYRRAHQLLGIADPQWCWRSPGRLEVGAKALVRALGDEPGGDSWEDVGQTRPGDLVGFHRRTGLISWKGHVGVVSAVWLAPARAVSARLRVLEGNVGEFPAQVQEFEYEVYENGVWFRRSPSGRNTVVRFWRFAGLR